LRAYFCAYEYSRPPKYDCEHDASAYALTMPSLLPHDSLAWLRHPRALRLALGLWGAVTVVITATVLWNPSYHSIYYIFPEAAGHWWAGHPLYTPLIDFFQYLPQAAILQTPFWLLGTPVGDVVWRWVGIALMLAGLWRLARLIAPGEPRPAFALIALLALLPSVASARNGQPNLQVAALMLLAALDLAEARYGRSAALLVLAFAVKPVALVLLLLVGALYPPMRWRLVLGIAVAAAIPFLTQDPSYVVDQYIGAFAKMLRSAQPDRNEFTDLNGVYWTLAGRSLDRWLLLAIQLGTALGTLLLGWIAVRRRAPAEGALAVWTLACCYLMLFNPRNEANAFVILAPAVAAFAMLRLCDQPERRIGSAIVAAIVVAFGLTGLTRVVHEATSPWLKPMLAAAFAVVMVRTLLRGEALFIGSAKRERWQGREDAPPAPRRETAAASNGDHVRLGARGIGFDRAS
jgi:hypothetical protein